MDDNLDLRVGGKYRLKRKLGEGGFASVYEGINLETDDHVAIKLEHISADPSVLDGEVAIYNALSRGVGIPQVYWSGTECEYNAIVFELLGPSLEDLFNFCNRRFSLKTVLMIADQLIYRLQYIHSKAIIHRDIKPENFLMGEGKKGNCIYVTDLGIAMSEYSGNAAKSHGLMGTPRFASIRGHMGTEQSSRDDLESLGYIFVYFLKGHLPWQSLKATTPDHKEQMILDKKRDMSPEELCTDLPKEFCLYFEHVRSLGFDDGPNYKYLRNIFRNLFRGQGLDYDNVFDWTFLMFMIEEKKRSKEHESEGFFASTG